MRRSGPLFPLANIVLLLQYSCLLAFLAMASSSPNITTDQSALIAFKSQLVLDPSHILSKNWTDNASVCSWIGLVCSRRHQRVSAIAIPRMGLIGNLSPQLGNLSFLFYLDLSRNDFHGALPHELSKLRRLRFVYLSFNNLNGEIPSWLGFLPRLQVLVMANNSFTGFIPPSLSNVSKLETLDLSFNPLNGEIPQEIGNLENLKMLSLQYNQLTGVLPLTIFNISTMEALAFTGNLLSGNLPNTICHGFQGLEEFYLSGNFVHGEIPANLSRCSKLRILSLSFNGFSGSIPKELGNLQMLELLYLGSNILTGEIPEELGNITTLKELYLADGKIMGSIPAKIFNISSLYSIDIANNKLSGMLPADICSHSKQLYEVFLYGNELYGQIPTGLFECSALRLLSLTSNKFYGSIPRELGNLTLLESIFLSNNQLTGTIPDEVGCLNNLVEISLSSNSLIGSIPTSLWNISALQQLLLGDNQLMGNLPSDLGYKLPNLEWLDLYYNNFTSEPPDSSFITSLMNCRYLNGLAIDENPLFGKLPASIGNLSSSLQYLHASGCHLTGAIPDEIGNLTNLIVLNLFENRLTGSVPTTLPILQRLQRLFLSSNKITGPIPSTICQLQNLNLLKLSDNQLSNAIPDCLGSITTLRNLGLDRNKLNSSIPESLWNLKDVLYLDLSKNSLSGPLSRKLGNLKAAIWVDLSANQFSGFIPKEVGELQILSTLYLEHNSLQGFIPGSVSEMVNLENFDLSHNNLCGSIPTSMEKLRYLTYLNVSVNDLSGEIPSGGPFQNFTSQSFLSNKQLCGDPRYNVPPCRAVKRPSRRHVMRFLVAFILSGTLAVVLAVLMLSYVLSRYRSSKERTPHDSHFWEASNITPRVSYNQLVKATASFSDSNFLGSGSFGKVYRGTFEDGKDVAVKVFNLQSKGAFKSFDVECEVLRKLRHRNLCKVISSCSNQDFRALILEYMPCGSLDNLMYSDNHPLDIIQRISIMIDVASALEYLHHGYSTPAVHCDLKPSNVLLDKDMTAHLCDFGVAKLLGEADSFVQTLTLGTYGYIAPEFGMDGLVSTSCDVYSYGVMLMEVFTRRKPNDDMFAGNLNLRSWVKNSTPDEVIHIIDSKLVLPHEECLSEKLICLSSILELALNCSTDSPHERLSIKDAAVALNKIKNQLLACTA